MSRPPSQNSLDESLPNVVFRRLDLEPWPWHKQNKIMSYSWSSHATSNVCWFCCWLLATGGELSKREGVLFHWWPFSSKWSDDLQLFYTDISLLWTSKPPSFWWISVWNGVSLSFLSFWGGAFGSERVHFHVQGVLAHPQNPYFSAPAVGYRAGEMIPEVEGTRPWGPSR